MFVGEVVHTRELDVISGIAEYARRIRELRVESGYDILSGAPDIWIPSGAYVLSSTVPDIAKAEKWRIANSIRNFKGNGKDRILAYLKHYVGEPVGIEMLAYVAKIREAR
jgi:hypothetical protein